jgi:hypothetical protein
MSSCRKGRRAERRAGRVRQSSSKTSLCGLEEARECARIKAGRREGRRGRNSLYKDSNLPKEERGAGE